MSITLQYNFLKRMIAVYMYSPVYLGEEQPNYNL